MEHFTLPDLTGLTENVTFTVSAKDSARAFGSGTVDVLATPALVAYMEQAALQLLAPYLPQNYTSVGSYIGLEHVGAAKIDDTFSCEVRITRIEERKVFFSISAFTSCKNLGKAKHVRVVLDRDRFMSRLNSPGAT